jgi:hypothetical protein
MCAQEKNKHNVWHMLKLRTCGDPDDHVSIISEQPSTVKAKQNEISDKSDFEGVI